MGPHVKTQLEEDVDDLFDAPPDDEPEKEEEEPKEQKEET